MTRFPASAKSEDEGLVHVYQRVNDMGHIWREFLRHDTGIDLVIELTEQQKPTGLLVAVQVKSGESFFRGAATGKVRIPVSTRHASYWRSYSLPVILVAYSPNRQRAYWKEIELLGLLQSETTSVACVEIDLERVFDNTCSESLVRLAKDHRNKARGFGISYRSKCDEDNTDAWQRLSTVLAVLLERSDPDYRPSLVPDESAEDAAERLHYENDTLLNEAEFLADLVRWDVSASEWSDPAPAGLSVRRFGAGDLAQLQELVAACRAAWRDSFLEEWLLRLVGGLLPKWREDVAELLTSSSEEIRTDLLMMCPVCYCTEQANAHEEIEGLSYTLGSIQYNRDRWHMTCKRCGTRFAFDMWGH